MIFRLILLAALIAAILYWYQNNNSDKPFMSINDQEGNISISVRKKDKEEWKKYLRKLKTLIYREATQRNPSGDVLPDQVDDRIIGEMKEKIN